MSTVENEFNELSAAFVEGLYAEYLRDPSSVSEDWRGYFASLGSPETGVRLGPSFPVHSVFNPPSAAASYTATSAPQAATVHLTNGAQAARAEPPSSATAEARARSLDVSVLQDRVDQMVRAFRVRGHMVAALDPLGLPRPMQPELQLEYYGFSDEDLDIEVSTRTIKGARRRTIREMLACLYNTYCRRIGVQFMHIDNGRVRQWLQDRMEGSENRVDLSRREQVRILTKLTDAAIFEEFLQKSFLGAKSFSLEGGETLIPLLDMMIERAAEHGVQELVLAMAHRGRLNVLCNIMGKSPQQIFREFADVDPELHIGRGDVKYHLGHSTDWITSTGRKVHLSLCFNPSHLEFVGPVALGRLRAKQDRIGDTSFERGMAILIHGDAAFAGEGVVQEMLNLSELEGYRTGGTIHVIVNNQIGFTTPPGQARSCVYATDVAKMLQSPIFHVNGEDPEAVAAVVQLAVDFRREFKRDVVIDMYCYRRRGHNEGDEPSFTQPTLYKAIERRKSVREGYLEHLLALNGVSREDADKIGARRREQLERDLSLAKSDDYIHGKETFTGLWAGYRGGPESEAEELHTGVERERLAKVLEGLTVVPPSFQVHPKIARMLEARVEMARGRRPLDWAAAEAAAFATLALDGYRVRLSGQDAERGTFSHRHLVLHDVETGESYQPIAHLSPGQAPVDVYNSPLSEAGVLGFDYGYSLDWPDGLVMWEAQFGDFSNSAQVIIDQFIVSAEDKWRRLSGLTLLLPHGFEGMGPEHSSARLERFLQLAGEDNIQIAVPTTPAQCFHLLRRQTMRRWRKPLVVMTPKSLLRHPKVVSPLEEFETGTFQRVLADPWPQLGEKIERVLLCSGKIYYDLESQREALGRHDVMIVRVEQLYPFPHEPLRAALGRVAEGTPVYWVQDEPENMGAWRYLRVLFLERLFGRYPFAGIHRHESASPATGSASSHKLEQTQLLTHAFGGR